MEERAREGAAAEPGAPQKAAAGGPWKGVVVPVALAVVVSVAATLLLGGIFRPGTPGPAGFAAGRACCGPGPVGAGAR